MVFSSYLWGYYMGIFHIFGRGWRAGRQAKNFFFLRVMRVVLQHLLSVGEFSEPDYGELVLIVFSFVIPLTVFPFRFLV